MKSLKKILLIACAAWMTLGFRIFDDHLRWNVNNSSAAKTKLFVVYEGATTNLTNNLSADDADVNTNPFTVTNAMNSVFNDYNKINAAYVTLVDNTDVDFAAESLSRTINVYRHVAEGTEGGNSKLDISGNTIVGCRINLSDSAFKDAKVYIATVTHELGHCLGLDHPQDTIHAIMSYFSNPTENYRLQMDDKMGLIYLYPVDPSAAKEDSTLGLSCARR